MISGKKYNSKKHSTCKKVRHLFADVSNKLDEICISSDINTVPDRSNLTGNALYWNGNGTLRGRQRKTKISVELERALNKKMFF